MHRLDCSHKRVSAQVIGHNELLHTAFMNHVGTDVPDPNMLMFTDGTAKDKRTALQRMGWSKVGTWCVQQKCFMHRC